MIRKFMLVAAGFLVGTFATLNISTSLSKPPEAPRYAIEDLRKLATTIELIKRVYVKPVSDDKLIADAISGMVSGLDPHSSYLDEETFKEIRIQTAGKFGGLGIEVSMDEDGFVKVISPIEGSPADLAGIRASDTIIKIDDTPVRGMKFSDAINRMRGEPKTKVTLTISRKQDDNQQILTFPLIRDVINVVGVKSKLIQPNIGYLRITQFQETTVDKMVEHLNKLQQQAPLKGLVLDLRNNPGGILEASIGVSAAFLTPGQVVVSTDGRIPEAKSVMSADPKYYMDRSADGDPLAKLDPAFKRIPIIVLVNGGSASASEIVAGALQDHRRAVIMGTKTFGKGSVQRLLPLQNDTAVKLTTALYFTPNKRSIQAEGIVPDILVKDPSASTDFTLREADLDRHIDKPVDGKAPPADAKKPDATEEKSAKPDTNVICRPVEKKEIKREPTRFGDDNDYQLQQALLFLRTAGNFDKNGRPTLKPAAQKPAPATADKK